MKKVEKERKIQETIFVAVDGTEFQYESECSEYEKTVRCVLNARYEKLVVRRSDEWETFRVGCEDNVIDFIRIKDEKDIDTVTELYVYLNGLSDKKCDRAQEFMSSLHIGVNLISRGYEMDYMSIIGTPDTIFQRLKEFCPEK